MSHREKTRRNISRITATTLCKSQSPRKIWSFFISAGIGYISLIAGITSTPPYIRYAIRQYVTSVVTFVITFIVTSVVSAARLIG